MKTTGHKPQLKTVDHNRHQAGGELKDPVCGMTVTSESDHKASYQGMDYFFCCAGCRQKFSADPEKYLVPRKEEAQDQNAWYTCPMDPEVRQRGPGTCPKCGMALEPETPTWRKWKIRS